ncbi:MAG: LamG-like jellyroll fold domain-containing protein [Planctomycetota bacterium]
MKLQVTGYFTISGGTWNENTGTIEFIGASNSYVDVVTTETFNNLTINKSSSGYIFNISDADTLVVNGALALTRGTLSAYSGGYGILNAKGPISIGAAWSSTWVCDDYLLIDGAVNQSFSIPAGATAPTLVLNNALTTVSFDPGVNASMTAFTLQDGTFQCSSGITTFTSTFVISGGQFEHNNGTVVFSANGLSADVASSVTFNNLTVNMLSTGTDGLVVGAGDTWVVLGDFYQQRGSIIGSAIFELYGNVTIGSGAQNYPSCASLTFRGSANQTYTDGRAGYEVGGTFVINKPGGSVILASDMDLTCSAYCGGQDMTITSGTLDMAIYNLTVYDVLTVGAAGTLKQGSGNLSFGKLDVIAGGVYQNNSTGDITVGTGNVANAGAITLNSRGGGCGTDDILIRSSLTGTQRAWTGAGTFTVRDVDVKDQAGAAAITAYSSTSTANNGANWTFDPSCPAAQVVWGDGSNFPPTGPWSTPENWTNDTLPVAGDVVVFSDVSVANCLVDANVNVTGIQITSGYTGYITQSGSNTITVGSGGFDQAGGTFSGSGQAIDVNGPVWLSSGASFASSSGTLSVSGDWTVIGTPAFNANGGNVKFDGAAAQTLSSGGIAFNNVQVANTSAAAVAVVGQMDVNGSLTLTSAYDIPGGIFTVAGNCVSTDASIGGSCAITLDGTGAQTLSAAGGDFPNGSFVVNKSSGTVTLGSALSLPLSVQTLTVTNGTLDMATYSITVNGAVSVSGAIILGAGTLAADSLTVNGLFTHGAGNIDVRLLTVSATGTYKDESTGDLTIGTGGVSNSGSMILNSAGGVCGTDDVAIRSKTPGVRVVWSGGGSYTFVDLNVQDQGGSAAITAYSSTNVPDSNGTNWTFIGTCLVKAWGGGLNNPITDPNWNVANNWTLNSVPTSSDLVMFDSTSVVNCTINVAASVAGVQILSTYSGTITQAAGVTLTVGVQHFTQQAGTFTGGDSAIDMNGDFILNGGSFTATTGVMTVAGEFSVIGGAFNESTGTVTFDGAAASIDVAISEQFCNLTFAPATAGAVKTVSNDDTLVVTGTLTLTEGYVNQTTTPSTGTIAARGAVTQGAAFDGTAWNSTGTLIIDGTGAQQLTGGGSGAGFMVLKIDKSSGTLTLSGTVATTRDWTYVRGTVAPGASKVHFPYPTTNVITGSHALNDVEFGYAHVIASGTTLTINGTLTLNSPSNQLHLGGPGIIELKGNLVIAGPGSPAGGNGGDNGTIVINGTGDQTITGTGTILTGRLPTNITIDKPSGTLYMAGYITLGGWPAGVWWYKQGTIDPGDSTVIFCGWHSQQIQQIKGSHTLKNVLFSNTGTSSVTIDAGTTLTLTGTLTIDDTLLAGPAALNGGTIEARGAVDIGVNADGGSTAITFGGSADQVYTDYGGDEPDGTFTINKPSGKVTLASAMDVTGSGQDLTITSGTLDMAGYALTVADALTVSGTLTQGAGLLTTGTGAATVTSAGTWTNLSTGDVTVGAGGVNNYGAITLNSNGAACNDTKDILIRSSSSPTQRAWTGSGNFTMTDLDVQDQAGTASIAVYSGTSSNNGSNWTISGSCLVSKTWGGGANNPITDPNWNVAGNWTGNAVPGAADVAVFDATSTVNCALDAVVNVAGIDIQAGYTGGSGSTITQNAGITVTVGGQNFTQAAGTFTGGDSAITVSGKLAISGGAFTSTTGTLWVKSHIELSAGTFSGASGRTDIDGSLKLSGGTYTATSGITEIAGTFTKTGGTFAAGGGAVVLNAATSQTVTPGSASFNHLVVNDFLAGYWRLDEGSGTSALDASGYGQTGSYSVSAPTQSGTVPTLKFYDPKSLQFAAGSTQYVTVADTDRLDVNDTEDLTIAGWFNLSSYTADHTIVAKRDGQADTDKGYIVYIDGDVDDKLYFEISDGTAAHEFNMKTATAFTAAGWHHFMVVWDQDTAANCKIYIDGVAVAVTQGGCAIATVGDTSNTKTFRIGAESDSGSPFDGYLDDIRVYKRTLTASDASTLFLGNEPGVGSVTWTLAGALDVDGDLTLGSGTLDVSASNYGISVAGNWFNHGGLFTPRAGTVVFDGGAAGKSILMGSIQPYNVSVTGAGGWTLASPLTMTGTLAISNGSLDVSTANYGVQCRTVNQTGGAFAAQSGTLTLASSSAGETLKLTSAAYNLTVAGDVLSGLELRYKFDEGAGTTAADATGNGHTGVLTGGAAFTGAGKFGGAAQFFDTNDKVLVGPVANLGAAWTIASWFMGPVPSNPGSWNTMTRGTTAAGSGDHHIIVQDSTKLLGMYDNVSGGNFRSSGYNISGLSPGWHHIAAVGTVGVTKFYIDGTYVGQSDRNGQDDVYCVGNYQGDAQRFSDNMDEFRVYNRALSAGEIATIASAAMGSNTTYTLGANLNVTGALSIGLGNTLSTSSYTFTLATLLTMTADSGTYTGGSNTQTFSGGVTVSGASVSFGSAAADVNGSMTMTGGTVTGTSGTMTVSGDWTKTGGTFTSNNGTVEFDGAGAQALRSGGTDAGSDFSTLRVNKTGGILSLTNDAISAGTLLQVLQGTFSPGALAVTAAAVTVDGGTLAAGAGALTCSGAFTESSGAFTGAGGAVDVNGAFALSGGAFTAPSGAMTAAGNFTISGAPTFTAGTNTITLDGTSSQTLTTGGKTFYNLTLANTGPGGGNTVALSGLLDVDGTLSITGGVLDQGANNAQVEGVSLGTGGVWSNTSTGDIVVGAGGVASSGCVSFNGGGAGCGADEIVITSSGSPTQRNWSGSGTFSLKDVNATDQNGVVAITAYSSTGIGQNNTNWTFTGSCGAVSSVASGNWNTPGTWDGDPAAVPLLSDEVEIVSGHTVTFDKNDAGVDAAKITVDPGATLKFDRTQASSLAMTVTGDVVVNGTLEIKANTKDGALVQTLELYGTDGQYGLIVNAPGTLLVEGLGAFGATGKVKLDGQASGAGGKGYIAVNSGAEATLRNAEIVNMGSNNAGKTGLYATAIDQLNDAEGLVVEGCLIHAGYRGIDINACKDVSIRDNKIYSNTNIGVNLQGAGLRNWIAGNLIYSNTSHGVAVDAADNTILVNNTINGNGGDGVYLATTAATTEIRANLVTSNTGNGINDEDNTSEPDNSYNDVVSNGTNYRQIDAGNQTGSKGNISSNPLYVNAGAFNFHLSAGSPALDTARPFSGGEALIYRFEENTGTSVGDTSVNANTGTLAGSWVPGRYGYGVSLNGSTGKVTAADHNSLDLTTRFTLEAWLRPDTLPTGNREIIYKYNSGGNTGYAMGLNSSGRVIFKVGTGSATNTLTGTTTAITAASWNHVVAVHDGTKMRIFVNAVEDASNLSSAAAAANGDTLKIGWDGGTSYLKGKIDEARLYNRALPVEQMRYAMGPRDMDEELRYRADGGGATNEARIAVDMGADEKLTLTQTFSLRTSSPTVSFTGVGNYDLAANTSIVAERGGDNRIMVLGSTGSVLRGYASAKKVNHLVFTKVAADNFMIWVAVSDGTDWGILALHDNGTDISDIPARTGWATNPKMFGAGGGGSGPISSIGRYDTNSDGTTDYLICVVDKIGGPGAASEEAALADDVNTENDTTDVMYKIIAGTGVTDSRNNDYAYDYRGGVVISSTSIYTPASADGGGIDVARVSLDTFATLNQQALGNATENKFAPFLRNAMAHSPLFASPTDVFVYRLSAATLSPAVWDSTPGDPVDGKSVALAGNISGRAANVGTTNVFVAANGIMYKLLEGATGYGTGMGAMSAFYDIGANRGTIIVGPLNTTVSMSPITKRVFFGTDEGWVYSIDEGAFTLVNRYQLPGGGKVVGISISGTTLFVTSDKGEMYAYPRE